MRGAVRRLPIPIRPIVPVDIQINSLEYQCWHEVGHVTVCLHLGGDVEFIELLDDETSGGLARARCFTNADIRRSVACGGFAAEFFLLRKGHLSQVDEKEIAQIIFRNATKDREMFCGRTLRDNEGFTKEDDEAFMSHAVSDIAPIFSWYFPKMRQVVGELIRAKKLDGKRIKEVLFPPDTVKWPRLIQAWEIENLYKAAEQGLADAQFNLGLSYAIGQGIAKNETRALAWFHKAAEQGHCGAQNNLGMMYANGKGVTIDKIQGVAWYRKAAEQGLADAQRNLALMYAHGEGVTKDKVQAVVWYRKAAEQGLAEAQYDLGFALEEGLGIPRDAIQAVVWYRKAAEQGLAKAQHNLGVMYAGGIGIARDKTLAMGWLRKAAEQGDRMAQYNLEVMKGS